MEGIGPTGPHCPEQDYSWHEIGRQAHLVKRHPPFNESISKDPLRRADVEIVGQPVSEADRKFWTSQKVLGGSSFL